MKSLPNSLRPRNVLLNELAAGDTDIHAALETLNDGELSGIAMRHPGATGLAAVAEAIFPTPVAETWGRQAHHHPRTIRAGWLGIRA